MQERLQLLDALDGLEDQGKCELLLRQLEGLPSHHYELRQTVHQVCPLTHAHRVVPPQVLFQRVQLLQLQRQIN